MILNFSSPEQRSGSAIVLPRLASAVVAAAATNVKVLKILGPHHVQILRWILFMIDMMIDIGPKFNAVPSPAPT